MTQLYILVPEKLFNVVPIKVKSTLEFDNGIYTVTNVTSILQIGQIENTCNCKSCSHIVSHTGYWMEFKPKY